MCTNSIFILMKVKMSLTNPVCKLRLSSFHVKSSYVSTYSGIAIINNYEIFDIVMGRHRIDLTK